MSFNAMSDTIIKVVGVGKKYRLHHQAQERYTTLRDTMAQQVKGLLHPKSKIQNPNSDEDFWAVKDVSFEIMQGEVVGIIGRNGAGKSTLLKILSRITEPTTGRITLRGRVASLLEVGTGFHPELTGRENIYLNGAILGMRKNEISAKFDEIVAFAEVEKFLDMPVKRYSSGMYVRLAFAVAAHLDPEILIVDEVLSVGDAQFQKKCLGAMKNVSQSGRTILYVSHDMVNISKLCDRGILLNAGKIELIGSMSSVISAYLTDESAALGYADLTKRKNRSGQGGARFQTLELLHKSKRVVALPFGDELTIKFSVDVQTPLGEANIEAKIVTDDGIFVHSFENANEGFTWNANTGRHTFILTIPKLMLAPGKYAIDLWLGDSQCIRVDYVQNAAEFHMIQTPTNQLARPFNRECGLVFTNASWSYEKS